MNLSQAAEPSMGIPLSLVVLFNICLHGGILIVMIWGIKRLRVLLSSVTGPWRPAARILEWALVLAFGLWILGVVVGIFSLATGSYAIPLQSGGS